MRSDQERGFRAELEENEPIQRLMNVGWCIPSGRVSEILTGN